MRAACRQKATGAIFPELPVEPTPFGWDIRDGGTGGRLLRGGFATKDEAMRYRSAALDLVSDEACAKLRRR